MVRCPDCLCKTVCDHSLPKFLKLSIHLCAWTGNNFGEGNLGARGFAKFLQTHRCNSICRYLNLSPMNPIDPRQDEGTAPTTRTAAGPGGSLATAGNRQRTLSQVPFREQHCYTRSHVLANVDDDSSSTALSHTSMRSKTREKKKKKRRATDRNQLRNYVSDESQRSPGEGAIPGANASDRGIGISCSCTIM